MGGSRIWITFLNVLSDIPLQSRFLETNRHRYFIRDLLLGFGLPPAALRLDNGASCSIHVFIPQDSGQGLDFTASSRSPTRCVQEHWVATPSWTSKKSTPGSDSRQREGSWGSWRTCPQMSAFSLLGLLSSRVRMLGAWTQKKNPFKHMLEEMWRDALPIKQTGCQTESVRRKCLRMFSKEGKRKHTTWTKIVLREELLLLGSWILTCLQ